MRLYTRKYWLLAVILFVAVIFGFAFNWPVSDQRMNLGFGSLKDSNFTSAFFMHGMEFAPGQEALKAADEGEIIFYADKNSLYQSYPITSLFAVSHKSDLLTLYTGFENNAFSTYLTSVKSGDVLGYGINSEVNSINFYCYDIKERRYINPTILLPQSLDDKPPIIRSATLIQDSAEIILETQKAMRQGQYDLIVDCYDMSPMGLQSAPAKIQVLIDGVEVNNFVYDASWVKAGHNFLFSEIGLDESLYVTKARRIRLGTYTFLRGRSVITIVALDTNNNKREQTYSIIVQ